MRAVERGGGKGKVRTKRRHHALGALSLTAVVIEKAVSHEKLPLVGVGGLDWDM
jgi:hypothetical protein